MKNRLFSLSNFLLALTVVAFGVIILGWLNEARAVAYVRSAPVDLSSVLAKATFDENDYDLLFAETGLGRAAVDALADAADRDDVLLAEQRRRHEEPTFDCRPLATFTKSERVSADADVTVLYDLRPGDVLLTGSTHTFFYRHGHSALVLDGDTLAEATVIGRPVTQTSAANWGRYPTGIHLRLSAAAGDAPADVAAEAARYAEAELLDDEYSLLAGAVGGAADDKTQCAYLIFAAYEHCGVTVSRRRFPVTPTSLLHSGAFDIVQCWGVDPATLDFCGH